MLGGGGVRANWGRVSGGSGPIWCRREERWEARGARCEAWRGEEGERKRRGGVGVGVGCKELNLKTPVLTR